MSDVSLSLVSNTVTCSPDATEVADLLTRALRGRPLPARSILARGEQASPEEGLALVKHLLAIKDARVRQALLDAASALASPRAAR